MADVYTVDWFLENPATGKEALLNGITSRIIPVIGDDAFFAFGENSGMTVCVTDRLINVNFSNGVDAVLVGEIVAARIDGVDIDDGDGLDAALDTLADEWEAAHPEHASTETL